jgi:hypothetical protein
MTALDKTPLEDMVKNAFADRANALPPLLPSVLPLDQHRVTKHRRNRFAVLAGVGAACLFIAAAVVAVTVDRHKPAPTRIVTNEVPTTHPASTVAAVPVGATGVNVPLVPADNADTRFLLHVATTQFGEPRGFAVQIPRRAAIVVSKRTQAGTEVCATVARPGDGGYQGGCVDLDEAASRLALVNDGGTWYIAWTRVPKGAVYVTFEYGPHKEWQRPLNGACYFTYTGAGPIPGVPLPELHAYDNAGTELGTARIVQ